MRQEVAAAGEGEGANLGEGDRREKKAAASSSVLNSCSGRSTTDHSASTASTRDRKSSNIDRALSMRAGPDSRPA
jgi:hypothetical protein